MEESDIRLEVQHLIRDLGFWDYHVPDDNWDARIEKIIKIFHLEKWNNAFYMIKNILFPQGERVAPGRPDIYGLNPRGYTCVIEVKTVPIKVNIEEWISPKIISNKQRNWLDAWSIQSMGTGFLAIGTLEGTPRDLWIIPWEEWIEIENVHRKDLRIPISMLPDAFKCKWIGGRGIKWELPTCHPLLGMATPSASPNKVDWKKVYSLRFPEDK